MDGRESLDSRRKALERDVARNRLDPATHLRLADELERAGEGDAVRTALLGARDAALAAADLETLATIRSRLAGGEAWSQWRAGPDRRGALAAPGPRGLHRIARALLPAAPIGSLCIDARRLVVLTRGRTGIAVHARDVDTLKPLWAEPVDRGAHASVGSLAGGDILVVASVVDGPRRRTVVRRLEGGSGATRTELTLPARADASIGPVAISGSLAALLHGGELTVIDAETLEAVWTAPAGDEAKAILIDADHLALLGLRRWQRIFGLASGKRLPHDELRLPVVERLRARVRAGRYTVAPGPVVAGGRAAPVQCIDMRDGKRAGVTEPIEPTREALARLGGGGGDAIDFAAVLRIVGAGDRVAIANGRAISLHQLPSMERIAETSVESAVVDAAMLNGRLHVVGEKGHLEVLGDALPAE